MFDRILTRVLKILGILALVVFLTGSILLGAGLYQAVQDVQNDSPAPTDIVPEYPEPFPYPTE